MSVNCYIIDTSSLIELNKHNPMDIYPGPWSRIESLINSDRLVSPKEVLDEIRQIDDNLADWAKKQDKLFKDPTMKQIELVREILKKCPSLIKDRPYDADPWVISLTLELANSPQITLVKIKRIVVTEEKLRGNKVKIPLICKDYNIESVDIIDMFREEGWKFY